MIFIRVLLTALLISFFASEQVSFAQSTTIEEVESQAAEEDLTLQTKVRGLIKEIPEFNNVFVTVRGGVVSLKGRVLELEQVNRAEELVSKMNGVVTVNNQITVESSVEKRLAPIVERFQERIGQLVTFLPIIGIGLVILFLVSLVGFLIAKARNPWDAIAPNRFIANLIRQFIRLAFVILGIVLALDVMGATALLSTILGAAGILGLALGFAVRDTVENYIASILLSFRQPFRPRDVVNIAGHEGYVIALTSRATVLLTYDGNHVRIPNATVFKGVITNYSRNPERRFSFNVGVETDDLQEAVTLGVGVLKELDFVLTDPDPDGWVEGIGESSFTLWFGAWINQNETSLAKARSEAIRKIKFAFEEAGINMPEPIYRLRFDEQIETVAASRKTKANAQKLKPKKPKAIAEEVRDVSPDRQLEKRVNKEAVEGDMLSETAPQEIGEG